MSTTLKIDDLSFEVRHSSRRRTLQITVERDGSLLLSAPSGMGEAALREFATEKRLWIYTKLAEKELMRRAVPRKEFVDGEGFLYLGRNYRLKLVEDQDVPLRFSGGRFRLRRDMIDSGRDHFVRWYSERAREKLSLFVDELQARMEVQPSAVKVQDLGYRWGSCGKGNCLYFHWKTILLPSRIVEYVAAHEMAHLHEPHHTPEFWLRLERAMPDYAQRKAWLAERGVCVEGL
ncbi:metal-dependent hydrolase [Luteimonas padinae]|uniref:M48 family metallopeptidase n=1 Tax=Luteimonas padinae TaxID=1714359 RepID=A0ABV6SVN8_9GAMM|nr:SprT family zinc-dependent metalloprotease [Luteimonas padinae]GHD72604.1 metal-dependent hydrolase [Luteimonas padinae]